MTENEKRQLIVDHCLEMNQNGLNQGTSGNISLRHERGMLISPSGIDYREMRAEEIVFVDHDGQPHGRLNPSSEWRFHLAILNRYEAFNSIVHSHPIHATALAICRQDIPAAHYMVAAAGGETIPCARYETFGTDALSEAVLEVLEGHKACLLANHGMIACGETLPRAMWLAVEVETLARQYVIASSIGTPHILDHQEMVKVTEKFRNYGRQPNRTSTR
ncbi:L-fuculose-phosphate aldolase [Kushneria sinocarnis]|uniref:L-fuculose-phosphate aldolase n=1 Tax=Kushneria sinocarnis TaxID=595502 RepID=A0A420X1K9_9GAMM|nr:class II aldolase/adducin family protein [Kushneria sinocarnis]RKR07692.1 L-fuculose-phosphate aldolase [Kushneria sinocarnis]